MEISHICLFKALILQCCAFHSLFCPQGFTVPTALVPFLHQFHAQPARQDGFLQTVGKKEIAKSSEKVLLELQDTLYYAVDFGEDENILQTNLEIIG